MEPKVTLIICLLYYWIFVYWNQELNEIKNVKKTDKKLRIFFNVPQSSTEKPLKNRSTGIAVTVQKSYRAQPWNLGRNLLKSIADIICIDDTWWKKKFYNKLFQSRDSGLFSVGFGCTAPERWSAEPVRLLDPSETRISADSGLLDASPQTWIAAPYTGIAAAYTGIAATYAGITSA